MTGLQLLAISPDMHYQDSLSLTHLPVTLTHSLFSVVAHLSDNSHVVMMWLCWALWWDRVLIRKVLRAAGAAGAACRLL